jgi:hypothetical protein
VLPEQRAAAAGDGELLAGDHQAGRQEEAGVGQAVHHLQDGRRLQRREGEQQQERGDELRPDEEGQPHPGQARRAELDDGDQEVRRPQHRGDDQEQHAEEPHRLPRGGDVGERRVGGPARLGGAPRREEARQHHHAAEEVRPVARHVELGERHVRRADLQRHQVVAEGAHGEGHDAQEHHDGAVHGPELVVELGDDDPPRRLEQIADQRHRLVRIGERPPHHHHQREAEEEEDQRREPILDADDLVVLGKDVLGPEPRLFVVVGLVMSVGPLVN